MPLKFLPETQQPAPGILGSKLLPNVPYVWTGNDSIRAGKDDFNVYVKLGERIMSFDPNRQQVVDVTGTLLNSTSTDKFVVAQKDFTITFTTN